MYFIGVDLGSTNIKVAIYSKNMKLVDRQSYPVEYIRKEGRFPILEVTKDSNGDLLIITGDTKGYFIRYTFSE